MKAVAATAPGRAEVVDVPMPEVGDYECLVKVRACGLCSTDLKIIDDHVSNLTVDYPVILGHESVGEVVELGSQVRNIQVGYRMTNPRGRLGPGTPFKGMWAGMAEYAVVQDQRVMDELGVDRSEYAFLPAGRPIPDDLSSEDAGVLLALCEAYSGTGNLGVRDGMEVLIYGDGPIGLALVNFARMRGAAWVGCVGHHDERLERIRERSEVDLTVNSRTEDVADRLGERQFDLVIDAVGSSAIIKEGSRMLVPGGKVGAYGVLHKEDATISLLALKSNTVLHMLNWPYREGDVHEDLIGLIRSGAVNPKDYYSHVMPVEQAPEAVEMVRSREAFKVVLTM